MRLFPRSHGYIDKELIYRAHVLLNARYNESDIIRRIMEIFPSGLYKRGVRL